MKPEHFSRHEQYLKTAKQIELAHRSYLEAMRAIEDEKDDATIYAHIKKANLIPLPDHQALRLMRKKRARIYFSS
jgi:hypothetical protein